MSTRSVRALRTSLFVAVLALMPFASPSHAQSQDHTLQVNVPFAFDYGPQHFAAGRYTLTGRGEHSMLLQGEKAGLSMTRPEQGQRASAHIKVVFHKYGQQYFLREVWAGGDRKDFVECVESKAEKLARQQESATALASNQAGTVGQEIALLVQ